MPTHVKLNNLSEIYSYFRKWDLPVFFVHPTPYNVLGLGQWVRSFKYISHFDSFDGHHHRVTVPRFPGDRTFTSKEDIVNYLLSHPDTHQLIQSLGGRGKMLTVMFDEQTEQLAKEAGLEIALPPAELRMRLDSKIVTTQLADEAGVPTVPNALGWAGSYAELQQLSRVNHLGDDLVVQTPYGDSGQTTFFIHSEEGWNRCAQKVIDQQLKVMKRINHVPYTLEAVATRHGTLVGPIQADIIGHAELTPYQGGWAGNDLYKNVLNGEQTRKVLLMTQAMGNRLYQEGYKGTFCLDFLIDTDTQEVYLGELNPRISGASALTNMVTAKYGGAPLMMFHMLEFMDVDYDLDIEKIQARWSDFDTWTQLVIKQNHDKVATITRAPQSGVWQMQVNGNIEFSRRSIDWHSVDNEAEAFFMRIYGEGDTLFYGADVGILVARGRMQMEDGRLTDRARSWIKAIHAQFETIA
jgi:carbamoylphosphate synthase large subunit